MDIFEKLNKTFANWYESWFGDEFGNIRPKDVLRKIINEMEQNRKEGLDSRVYVPNRYILELSFENNEEKEYLLAFLDKEELDNALRKYLDENKYYLRGPLDFTIEEIESTDESSKPEKLTVKCKWDVRPTDQPPIQPDQISLVIPELAIEEDLTNVMDYEDLTVAAVDIYDDGTISPPVLNIKKSDGTTTSFVMRKPSVTIGRSHRMNNDIIIDSDGMISKQHARISMQNNGFTITDLKSTNGVWLNGERVNNTILKNGDIIQIGSTEITFETGSETPYQPVIEKSNIHPSKLMEISNTADKNEYLLASDMVIGRSLGSDIRIDDPSVSRKHARIYRKGADYFIKDLQSRNGTKINDVPALPDIPIKLHNGDRIKIGEVELDFELGRIT